MQQDVIGKSALIALAGFMTSVVIVAGGVIVAPPSEMERPRELPAPAAPRPTEVAAAPAPLATPEVARERAGIDDAVEPWPSLLASVRGPRELEGRVLAPRPALKSAGVVAKAPAAPKPSSPKSETTTRLAAVAPSRDADPARASSGRRTAPRDVPAGPPGVPPWRRYAALPPSDDSRPMIVVIIDDLGLNAGRMRRAMALPKPMTLAVLPYGDEVARLAGLARQAGHEVLLHLPMEPHSRRENPGPNALLVDLDPGEVARRIEWNLDRFAGYVGVNNHMGSRFTERWDKLDPLMRRLRSRGLLFVDSVTSVNSVAGEAARSYGIPTVSRDVFIDHVIDRRSIEAQLRRVERVARRRGQAIALGHPHRETLEALERWLPSLRAKGFSLAPVSAVVARRRTG